MTTKDRILDAAERLFAHHGIEATSLRNITTEAGVNLAAVNYHFQSKEALLHAVIARRIDPVNEVRLAKLAACEAAAGDGPLPLDGVIDALLRPVMEMMRGPGREFAPMMARIFTESSVLTEKIFEKHLAHVARRFFPAIHRALPDLPQTELTWRLLFTMGAVAHTIGGAKLIRVLSNGLCDPGDVEGIIGRLEAFLLAGMRAPVGEVEHVGR